MIQHERAVKFDFHTGRRWRSGALGPWRGRAGTRCASSCWRAPPRGASGSWASPRSCGGSRRRPGSGGGRAPGRRPRESAVRVGAAAPGPDAPRGLNLCTSSIRMLGPGRSGVTVPPATATRGRALRSLCLLSLSLLCLELGRLATSRRGGCVTERPPRPRKFIRSHHDAMGRAPCHSWRVALGQPGGAGRKAPRAVMWTIAWPPRFLLDTRVKVP